MGLRFCAAGLIYRLRSGRLSGLGKVLFFLMKNHVMLLVRWLTVAAFTAAAVWLLRYCGSGYRPEYQLWYTLWAALIVIPLLLYFLLTAVLCLFFRETASPDDAALPGCAVVIPAYNEGAHIADSLRSVLRSDYPREKLDVIAVNDGSIDDTGEWISAVMAEFPGRINFIDSRVNLGKRQALYIGFQAAGREIIVTIDSDSTVEPDTLRRIVAPFSNPRVGAVSGNVLVKNGKSGLWAGMLESVFAFGFDFLRRGQSVPGCVVCAPGALSAFRASALDAVGKRWAEMTFLGVPASIGEDFTLTTMIIEQGWDAVLQHKAVASTNVPETYSAAAGMLLRWQRGTAREMLRMCSFVFRDFHWCSGKSWFLLFTLIVYFEGAFLPCVSIAAVFLQLFLSWSVLLRVLACACIWSLPFALANLSYGSCRRIVNGFLYGCFFAFTMFWIIPYALVTLRNTSWVTRGEAGAAGKR